MQNEESECIDKAVNGDKKALSSLLSSVQDMVYNQTHRLNPCPKDKSPLLTILEKKLISYHCEIDCVSCQTRYTKENAS